MPESLSKRRLDASTLDALIADARGAGVGDSGSRSGSRSGSGSDIAGAGIQTSRELTEGFFNTAFRLLLTDGRDVVLKASPPQGLALLTYERDIMRAEVEFFRAAAASGVPLPDLVHAGLDRTVIDGDYVLLSAVDGVTWYSARESLDAAQTAALRRELGGCLARLHRVAPPGGLFGYPAVPELSARTWPDAFAAMLGALVDDAQRFGVDLPATGAELKETVRRHAPALAEIGTPALVHFDLWPGNVLITDPRDGSVPTISGLIDGERMIWGDPLMEFVGVDVFGRADQDPDIRAGYLDAGGVIADDTAAQRRLALYHLYMQLLLLIETVPRGYTDQAYLAYITSECPKRIQAAVAELG